MAGDKYFKDGGGGLLTEQAALQASAGAGDAGKIPALDATGRMSQTMMPVGIVPDTASIIASENLAAGDYVNVWNNAAAFNVRKSDGTVAGKEAHGFVLAAVTAGQLAAVYFEGPNTAVTGQTPGVVFLSTTAGLGTPTAPSAAGNAVQRIGIAVSATVVNFQYNMPFIKS